jgi:hypothetical protein
MKSSTLIYSLFLFSAFLLTDCRSRKEIDPNPTNVEDAIKLLEKQRAEQTKKAQKAQKKASKEYWKRQTKAAKKSIKRNNKVQKRIERDRRKSHY